MAAALVGSMRWAYSALNCLPCTEWVIHAPLTIMDSPAAANGKQPTTVTVSPFPSLSLRTVYPFSSFLKITFSTVPDSS